MIAIIIFSLFMCIFCTDAAEGPEHPGSLTGDKSARNYSIVECALAQRCVIFAESPMLQVLCALSQPNFFQNANPVLQLEIDIILDTLRQNILIYPDQLTHTFCQKDHEVRLGAVDRLDALGECVPAVNPSDIQNILDSLSNVLTESTRKMIAKRYEKQGSERFSYTLRYALWTMESPDPKSQVERRAWFRGESSERHYRAMKSNLSKENVVFEDSTMMEVCYELSHSDYFQKTDVWLQTEIEVILYLLCQESSKNAKALAKTFGEEDEKVMKGQTTILDAFGKCVPDFDSNKIKKVLKCLPKDVPSRFTILKNTRNRYQRYNAERRFTASLTYLLNNWKVHPESDVQHPQPLPERSLPMQSAVVYPESDVQHPHPLPESSLPMQSAVVYPEFDYQYPSF
ncbi:MAG: hypothetical protein OXC30_03910, partial [Alphaproteobacteria bacterium]|nr:hypothetical protein [Alphaproteobacteria bacterium]